LTAQGQRTGPKQGSRRRRLIPVQAATGALTAAKIPIVFVVGLVGAGRNAKKARPIR
jgi:hypothetical protein